MSTTSQTEWAMLAEGIARSVGPAKTLAIIEAISGAYDGGGEDSLEGAVKLLQLSGEHKAAMVVQQLLDAVKVRAAESRKKFAEAWEKHT